MSLWFRFKRRDGGIDLVGADFPLSLVIILPCLLAAFLAPFFVEQSLRYGAHSIGLVVTGVLSLALSKTHHFRRGRWLSWGTADMPVPLRVFYYLGYALISMGLVVACLYVLTNS